MLPSFPKLRLREDIRTIVPERLAVAAGAESSSNLFRLSWLAVISVQTNCPLDRAKLSHRTVSPNANARNLPLPSCPCSNLDSPLERRDLFFHESPSVLNSSIAVSGAMPCPLSMTIISSSPPSLLRRRRTATRFASASSPLKISSAIAMSGLRADAIF